MNAVLSQVIEAENDANVQPLSAIPGNLHQIQGSLKMVELEAASLLANDLEQLCLGICEPTSVLDRSKGLSVLRNGLEALKQYIDSVARQSPMSPFVLVDKINQVRTLNGEPAISRFDLFAPALGNLDLETVGADKSLSIASISKDDRDKIISGVHLKYRRALLGWLVGKMVQSNKHSPLAEMSNLLMQLMQISSLDILQQLWWVASSFVEAVESGALELNADIKSQFARLDVEISRLQDDAGAGFINNPPDELLRRLLFYIGTVSDTESARIRTIQQSLDLPEWFGYGDNRYSLMVATSAKLGQLSTEFSRQTFDEFEQGLNRIFKAGEQERIDSSVMTDHFQHLAKRCNEVQLPELAALVENMIFAANSSAQLNQSFDNDQADIEIASSLLFIRDSILNPEGIDGSWTETVENYTANLQGLAGEFDRQDQREVRASRIASVEYQHALSAATRQIHEVLEDVEDAITRAAAGEDQHEFQQKASTSLSAIASLFLICENNDASDLACHAAHLLEQTASGDRILDADDYDRLAFTVATFGVAADHLVQPLLDSKSFLDDAAEKLQAIASSGFVQSEDLENTATEISAPALPVDETVFSEELTGLTDETVFSEELTGLTDETVFSEELTGLADETVFSEELTGLADETVFSEELTGLADETVFSEELTGLADETVFSEELTGLADETVFSEELTDLVDETVFSEELTDYAPVADQPSLLTIDELLSADHQPFIEDPPSWTVPPVDSDSDVSKLLGDIDESRKALKRGDISALTDLAASFARLSVVDFRQQHPAFHQLCGYGFELCGKLAGKENNADVQEFIGLLVRQLKTLASSSDMAVEVDGWDTKYAILLETIAQKDVSESVDFTDELDINVDLPQNEAPLSTSATPELQLDEDLKNIFVEELARHIRQLETGLQSFGALSDQDGKPSLDREAILTQMDDCVHTLCGNCNNLGLNAPAESIETAFDLLRYPGDKGFMATSGAHFERCLSQLKELCQQIALKGEMDNELEQSFRDQQDEARVILDVLEQYPANGENREAAPSNTVVPDVPGSSSDTASEPDEEITQIFLEETESILGRVNTGLLQWRETGLDSGILGAVRREFHTLKGSAAATGFDRVSRLSHSVESLLDQYRLKEDTDTGDLLGMLEEVHDGLAADLGILATDATGHVQSLIARIDGIIAGEPVVATSDGQEKFTITSDVEEAAKSSHAGVVQETESVSEAGSLPHEADNSVDTAHLVTTDERAAETVEDMSQETGIRLFEFEAQDEPHALPGEDKPFRSEQEKTSEQKSTDNQQQIEQVVSELEQVGRRVSTLLEEDRQQRTSPTPGEFTSSMRSWMPSLEPDAVRDQAKEDVVASSGSLRIDNSRLAEMINTSGELGLLRTQLQNTLDATRMDLDVLRANMSSMRDGLRELELEADAQIGALPEQQLAVDEEFDPLQLDRYSGLQAKSRDVVSLLDQLAKVERDLEAKTSDISGALQSQLHLGEQLQSGLMSARMVAISEYLPRLRHLVRETSRQAGKPVELAFAGGDILVDRQVIESLMAPFEHMIRNSVVHGIETRTDRERRNKSEPATIALTFVQQGVELVVTVSDNGRGLDIDKLNRRAVELGLAERTGEVTEIDLLQIITQPGYSTSDTISMRAGRGVGMDVVYQAIKGLGGSIMLSNNPGNGVTFQFRLPVTLALTQALLVRAGSWRFAIRTRTVERLLRVAPTDVIHEGGDRFIEVDEQRLPLINLLERIQGGSNPVSREQSGDNIHVVLVRLADRVVPIQVDQFEDSVNIVSKSPGRQLLTIPEVSGVTVLPDSSIILILDPEAFVDRIAPMATTEPEAEVSVATTGSLRRVLVVDDSLVVRKVMQKDLEADGLDVETAIDGVNALDVLAKGEFDMALVDVEMPRMNGYELLTELRKRPEYQQLPVIIITSRSGDQHRRRAMELGADGYITKPYDIGALDQMMREVIDNKYNIQ